MLAADGKQRAALSGLHLLKAAAFPAMASSPHVSCLHYIADWLLSRPYPVVQFSDQSHDDLAAQNLMPSAPGPPGTGAECAERRAQGPVLFV